MLKPTWAIKYRPSKIENYIYQNDNHKNLVEKYIQEQSIPNLLLHGTPGTGKTTLGYILKEALGIEDSDFLFMDASNDNGVDHIRDKINSFARTISTGPFKLILMDEADRLSSSAQDALRHPLENPTIASNARFILTANNPHKFSPAIHSRFHHLEFSTINKEAVLIRAAEILTKENISVSSIELLEKYIDMSHPDFRRLLMLLEQNSINGKLLDEPISVDTSMDYKLEVIEHLEKNNWQAVRTVVAENVNGDEWVELYKFLYEFIHEVGKFKDPMKWKQAIIIIADFLYKNAIVADQEINFVACIIRLTEI